MRRTARPLLVPAVAYLTVATRIVASWSIWWYGASFGIRALIEVMPVLVLGLAALVESARTTAARRVLATAFVVTRCSRFMGWWRTGARRSPTTETSFHEYLESFRHW